MDLNTILPGINPFFFVALMIWSLFWKSLAVWRAAKGKQRYWFMAILLINTMGILDIVYLVRFSKDKMGIKDFKSKNFLP